MVLVIAAYKCILNFYYMLKVDCVNKCFIMDIGSEISEKIQLAIKAKLKEINAYVDDELPDYIMIMIANRKPEEQMAEALSLFLANNSKAFTKWLYELLGSLREKSDMKKEVAVNKSEDDDLVKSTEAKDIKVINVKGTVPKATDSNKASRWDVKKHVEKTSETSTEHKVAEVADDAAPKEAVIDISLGKSDLFDEELLADNEIVVTKHNKKQQISTRTDKISKSGADKSVEKPLQSSSRHDKEKTITPIRSSENKLTESSESKKNKSDTKKDNRANKEDSRKSETSGKRTVALKTSKDSARKLSTTDKEFSTEFAPPKTKKKKLKRSREKEYVSAHSGDRHGPLKTFSKPVREWDKNKGKEPLKYNDSDADRKSKKHERREKVEPKVLKSKVSSQIVSTSKVGKESQYESEDSDDNPTLSGVISKVAVPQRRSRLPPSKQANRSLLLKAVSDAESSIKKHCITNKIIEPISEEVFKTRVEKTKRIALGEVLEKPVKFQENISKRNVSSRLLRETNLLKPESGNSFKKEEAAKKRKSSLNNESRLEKVRKKRIDEQEVANVDNNLIPVGDSRRIISRDQASSSKAIKKVIRRSLDESEIVTSSSHDTRKLAARQTSTHIDKNSQTVIPSKSTKDQDSSTLKSHKVQKRNRSPSPCFIVTLDGSSKGKINQDEKSPSKKIAKTFSAKPSNSKQSLEKNGSDTVIKLSPLKKTAAENTDCNKTLRTTAMSSDKTNTSDVDNSSLSENELEIMKKKLLAMQEQAKRLKELQSKQQELLQQKLVDVQSVSKPNNKTIHLANVHFSATEKQISEHFSICGKVANVTLLKDQFTGHPKGFAYIEFEEEKSIEMALALDGSAFCGRNINVSKTPNELSATTSSFINKRFHSSKRFGSSRVFKRYNPRALAPSRPWARSLITRNKTWVKPGFTPS